MFPFALDDLGPRLGPFFHPLRGKIGLLTPLDMFRTKNHTGKVRLTAKDLEK